MLFIIIYLLFMLVIIIIFLIYLFIVYCTFIIIRKKCQKEAFDESIPGNERSFGTAKLSYQVHDSVS